MTVASAEWGVVTHPGTVRTVNQDSVIAGPRLFVVADGMGGHASGDVASAIAVARLAALGASEELTTARVLRVLQSVNTEIVEQGFPGSGREGMGTTIAGIALIDGDEQPAVMVFNVGDSRIYRCSDGQLEQVSADHSVVAELIRAGRLDPSAAPSHPERHVITRALGAADAPDVDHWLLAPEPGDRFLICSDGLTNEVSDFDIKALLASPAPPQDIADALLAAALDNGARDNVSAIIIEVAKAYMTPSGGAPGDDTAPRSVPLDDDTTPRAAPDDEVIVQRPPAITDISVDEPGAAPVVIEVVPGRLSGQDSAGLTEPDPPGAALIVTVPGSSDTRGASAEEATMR